MKKIILSTCLFLFVMIVPTFALDAGITPYADMVHKSSYRLSATGVKLTFYSTGNYTSNGVTVGGLDYKQTAGDAYNKFMNVKMTKQSGKTNPYAKCTFQYMNNGIMAPATAAVNVPLVHDY